ncbi:MAG: DUF6714 family protein [Myxococcota bacterium]
MASHPHAALLDQIRRAFSDVPPPDAEHRTLRQAEAWDDYRIVDQARDHKGPWWDLPDAHIRECQNAIPHLDAQGIHYYLPALMSHFVRSEPSSLWVHQSLLYFLQPSTGDLKDYQRGRMVLFTYPQRQAILAFLQHIDAPEASLRPWLRVEQAGDVTDWFRHFY